MFAQIVLLAFLANSVAAWNFKIFYDTNFNDSRHHLEYFSGWGLNKCIDWSGTVMNDHVKSFKWNNGGINCEIIMFKNKDCKGTKLGNSGGNWNNESVSAAGQQMSSARISCAN